jgi:suppressor of ftsI/bilirubin oxidase
MTSRRTLLIAGAAGAAGIAGGIAWWRAQPTPQPPFTPDLAFPNALRVPGAEGLYGVFDVAGSFTISAKPVQQEIVPGKAAAMLAYEVEHQGARLLNPLIRLRSGAKIHAKHWNGLDETSIIHWHGLTVDSNNDGHPHYAVAGGETYEYSFAVPNRAATYWYHPHPHHLTGKQVYLGLGGVFIVEDDEELALQKALDLQLGVTDIPLVLHDRRLDAQGQLVFNPTDEDKADGFLGAQVLVNWTPQPYFEASTRIYRFRILNASNARPYKLAFQTGGQLLEFQLIGTDGGLIDSPRKIKEAFISPAERIDVLLDLRNAKVGELITLTSVAFDAMEQEDGPPGLDKPAETAKPAAKSAHAMHGTNVEKETKKDATPSTPAAAEAKERIDIPEIGAAMELMRIHVRRKEVYERAVPATLSRIVPIAANCASPRVINLDHVKMVWRINGETYETEKTPITVKRGATEVWNIQNAAASMPHPFHIHGFQYQVLERRGSPVQQKALAINEKGLAASDLGWKDTVLVWPGETVCIAIDFTHPFNGDQVYMIHCHNLEHEDQGMMLNLKVEA